MPYFYLDTSYIIFVVPALILAFWAQMKVSSTYSKFSSVPCRRGLTGADVSEKILKLYGIYNVRIEPIAGNLTDCFDPRSNVIRLSEGVYNSTSVAAIGVAAHETGHAIQHAQGYMPIKLRNAVIPVANIGSYAAFPLVIFGLIFSSSILVNVGIVLFSAVVAFQFVTLPVEFNASRRALTILENQAILDGEDLKGAKKVLTAAALTYVAAAAVALGNLLRLISISNRKR